MRQRQLKFHRVSWLSLLCIRFNDSSFLQGYPIVWYSLLDCCATRFLHWWALACLRWMVWYRPCTFPKWMFSSWAPTALTRHPGSRGGWCTTDPEVAHEGRSFRVDCPRPGRFGGWNVLPGGALWFFIRGSPTLRSHWGYSSRGREYLEISAKLAAKPPKKRWSNLIQRNSSDLTIGFSWLRTMGQLVRWGFERIYLQLDGLIIGLLSVSNSKWVKSLIWDWLVCHLQLIASEVDALWIPLAN